MAIEFWLSYNNNAEKLRLPVNPESLSVSSPFSHSDLTVARLGEYSVIGERELKEFSFGSFFPQDYNATYCEYANFPAPKKCLETIERWRDQRKPIRFIVTGTSVNFAVTIREFNYEIEKAGHSGDIYFTLTLKEYRFLPTRKKTATPAKTSTKTRPPVINSTSAKKTSSSYTVKSGDSLSKIAKAVYNNAAQWRKIYEANKKAIGANPNKIKIGLKLVIPK